MGPRTPGLRADGARVVEIVALPDIQLACRAARGATTGIKRSFGDLLDGYVLCLGPR